MVQLRFLHAPLAGRVVKKLKHVVEWLLRIVDDVGKSSSLWVIQKVVLCHTSFRHSSMPRQYIDTYIARAIIVSSCQREAMALPHEITNSTAFSQKPVPAPDRFRGGQSVGTSALTETLGPCRQSGFGDVDQTARTKSLRPTRKVSA